MVELVNGFVCFNCTDTERAAKGIDPANPTGDPALDKKHPHKSKDPADPFGVSAVGSPSHAHAARRVDATGKVSDTLTGRAVTSLDGVRAIGAILPPGVGLSVDVTA